VHWPEGSTHASPTVHGSLSSQSTAVCPQPPGSMQKSIVQPSPSSQLGGVDEHIGMSTQPPKGSGMQTTSQVSGPLHTAPSSGQ
jgi:hypothetical protein